VRRKIVLRFLTVTLALAAVTPIPARAEVRFFGIAASTDLPAGFVQDGQSVAGRAAFHDPANSMELDLLSFVPSRYATARAAAEDVLGRLGSTGEVSAFLYQGRPALIAELSFLLDGQRRVGHALFTRDERSGAHALLGHAAEDLYARSSELIISCLDGFSLDAAARRAPGPVSQFLLSWPPTRDGTRSVRLPTGIQQLPWSAEEAAHEMAIAEREHRILTSYAQSRTLWVDAWARFYRMVDRESAARLEGITDRLARSLPGGDPAAAARRVLEWVQGFSYERDTAGLDFVPPLAAAFERRGDCDARAMVMGMVLERMGIDCVLMLSREYSHALLGVDVPGEGARFAHRGRQYLVAETTAVTPLGTVAREHADASKWIGVSLGE
jgi:hypothetical protein